MTVAELIKELEKIEDKNLDVILGTADESDCIVEYVVTRKEWYLKENSGERRKCVILW